MSPEDEIATLLSTYGQALKSGDLDAAVGCYTADAVVAAPAVPTATGPGVRDLYAQILGALRLDITFTLEQVIAPGGEEVVAFTRSEGTQTDVAAGTDSPEANREAFVFTRQDGSLKISRYLFNTVR